MSGNVFSSVDQLALEKEAPRQCGHKTQHRGKGTRGTPLEPCITISRIAEVLCLTSVVTLLFGEADAFKGKLRGKGKGKGTPVKVPGFLKAYPALAVVSVCHTLRAIFKDHALVRRQYMRTAWNRRRHAADRAAVHDPRVQEYNSMMEKYGSNSRMLPPYYNYRCEHQQLFQQEEDGPQDVLRPLPKDDEDTSDAEKNDTMIGMVWCK